jgi:hypothetical protein
LDGHLLSYHDGDYPQDSYWSYGKLKGCESAKTLGLKDSVFDWHLSCQYGEYTRELYCLISLQAGEIELIWA